MPIDGKCFPTQIQKVLNCFAIVYRNFNPFLIIEALKKTPFFLYLVLSDLTKPRAGDLSPITELITVKSSGGVINFHPEWNMPLYIKFMDVLLPELAMIQAQPSPKDVFEKIKARYIDLYLKFFDYIEERIFGAPLTNADMDGLANAVDDGTNYAVYGNINRATNPNWSAVVISLPPNAYPAGKEFVAVLYVLNKYKETKNGQGPNLVLCSYETFYALCKSLIAMERIITSTPDEIDFTKGAGFSALNLNGLWIFPSNKLSGGTAYFIDTTSFVFYIHPEYFFAQSDWVSLLPINVYGYRTALTFAGNFVCLKPWNNIKVTNMPTATL